MSGVKRNYKQAKDKVSPVCFTITTVVFMVLPASMVFMGVINLQDCPAERFIPIYLVVSGAFTCFFLLLWLMKTWRQDGEGHTPVVLKVISVIVGLFLFAWFIAGNVWIYSLYNKYSRVSTHSNYCDNTFYLYAFWMTTLTYILLGVSIVVCCICMACVWNSSKVDQK